MHFALDRSRYDPLLRIRVGKRQATVSALSTHTHTCYTEQSQRENELLQQQQRWRNREKQLISVGPVGSGTAGTGWLPMPMRRYVIQATHSVVVSLPPS